MRRGSYIPLALCRRHVYNRFCEADQYVVPFHPPLLLAWGAHMNIQAVTNSAWSFYVLKVCCKRAVLARCWSR